MKHLTSINNSLIRRVDALQQSTRRRMMESLMVVEGFRLVSEALNAGVDVTALFFTTGFLKSARFEALEQFDLQNAYQVSDEVFDKISDTVTPQGVLILCRTPELVVDKKSPVLYLLLDQVRDPGNMGTMLRTAWAAGVTAVLLPKGNIDITNPKVVRAGMGAHFHVPIVRGDWELVGSYTRETEIWIAESDRGLPYDRVNWHNDTTIIIGGEAEGAGSQAMAIATPVHIPMHTSTESLNAAIACGVILFEVCRQRRM
jgi:TrmH family RNA methyltransferase